MEENRGNLVFLPNNNTEPYKEPAFFDAEANHKTLCDKLASCHDLSGFSSNILSIVNRLGFTDFIFIRLERKWQTGSKRGLLYSLPEEMMEQYQESHLHRHDLLLSYGRNNSQPILGSQVYDYVDDAPFEMELTIKNRQLRKFYRRYHYSEHLAIPTGAINGSGNVLLILTSAGKSKEEVQKNATSVIPVCRVLCKAIDSISTKKFRSTFVDVKDSPVSLTPKPLAVLQALATTDSNITDVAEYLCISPITAHQHVAAARKALGVNTNIGAIVKAVKTGLVRLD